MRFTPAQQQAIEADNRELLVSAAAGSGKTAVLVERIVRMIGQKGMSIDKMLIVTFTRAAAGEMRERLEKRLSEMADGDARLQRQADLVASAQISTIHAFCQQVVRQHFQHCKIDPQFGLCDERTRAAFYEESMEETLDWLYDAAREDEAIASLCTKFPERDIAAMLDTLYRFLMSRPDPMEWLETHASHRWSLDTLDTEPMAQAFCREAALIVEGMLSLCREADALSKSPAFPPPYVNVILSDREDMRRLEEGCQAGMTRLIAALETLKWMRLPAFRAKTNDEGVLAERFKDLRSRWKDMADELKKLLPQDASAALADLDAMQPATQGLKQAMLYFHAAFSRRKQEQAVIDFNDLEHMTLSVLLEPSLQQELQNRFDAIFVDEYQDVSELQEAILNGLKRSPDVPPKQYAFYVGDVKQSIYRFRLAEPGLFLGKFARFSAEETAEERKIVLNRNFRSKTAVLNAVNRVFAHVMDSRVTEIDYDADAQLYPGTPSTGDPITEMHILASDGLRPQDQVLAEAEVIARDILAHVGQPMVDGEGNECGLLKFSDIAVLLPVSKGVSDKVELVFSRMGIPVYCEGAGDAMASDEITQLIQYLTLMDNLMNDVALLSVLRSPLFEMSEQELSAVRLTRPEREASFLMALTHASKEADEPLRARCASVLHTLETERFYLNSMPLAQYLWDFLGRSGLYAHFGAQPGGKLRQANLRMLCHRAADYEQSHADGLHGFVESLLLDSASGSETSPTVINPFDNVVRIMTIHKSKGLEFPTVYVMNLGRNMFGRAATRAVSVHGDIGFGLGYVNEQARTRRTTLVQSAIALRERSAERAERARVLYVALTRPKSRLVMVGSASLKSDGPDAVMERARLPKDVYAVRQATSMLDWLLQCVEPTDAFEVFSTQNPWKIASETTFSTVSTSFPHKTSLWRVVFHTEPVLSYQMADAKEPLPLTIPLPDDLSAAPKSIARREDAHDPVAPQLHFSHLPLKVGVTALCRAMEEKTPEIDDAEETADLKRYPYEVAQPRLLSSLPALPDFLAPPREERALMTGVQTHRVLGLINLDGARQRIGQPRALYAYVCSEVERMESSGILTEQEASFVNRSMIARFFESDLGLRMLQSETVMREWSFNLRVTEPFPTLVQGVIDLCFVENGGWVLVDFKTDRVESAADLYPRYRRQLDFYRQALTMGTPMPVKECLLYSLRLGESFACK